MKNLIGIGVIFLLLLASIPALAVSDKELSFASFNNNNLFVGGSGSGNYSSIQEAVNASSNGDTVFVFDDSSPYYEHIRINKTISLVGEKKETTIIDGSYTSDVIYLLADGIRISGFTIQHCGNITTDSAIRCNDPYLEHLQISGVIIRENHCGLYIHYAKNFTILSNDLINNTCAISFYECRGSNVSENRVEDNYAGIEGSNMHEGTFSRNTIRDNKNGINLDGSECLIHHNLFEENDVFAIEMVFSFQDVIQYNEFRNNSLGIQLINSWNSIKFNNFIENQKDLNITENLYLCFLPYPHSVFWHNYWADHRIPLPKMIPIELYWLSLFDGTVHFKQGMRFDLCPALFPHQIDKLRS
jgi:parallel beta-helix repeat protein